MLRFNEGGRFSSFLLIISLLHLHPCVFKCFTVTAHLSHYIVHVNVSFSAFISWHEFEGLTNASFGSLSSFFLGTNVLSEPFSLPDAEEEEYDCQVGPGVGVATLAVEVQSLTGCLTFNTLFCVYFLKDRSIQDSEVTLSCLAMLVISTETIPSVVICVCERVAWVFSREFLELSSSFFKQIIRFFCIMCAQHD